MDGLCGFPITSDITVEVRGVKGKTRVAILRKDGEKITNEVTLSVDHWTELFKMSATIDHFTTSHRTTPRRNITQEEDTTMLHITCDVTVYIESVGEESTFVKIARECCNSHGMEEITMAAREWTEFYLSMGMINNEFYRRFKYQYADG